MMAPHLVPLELLTLDEVAALTKRARRTIEREVAADPPVLKSVMLGGRRLVPRAELERYIAEAAGYDEPTSIDSRRTRDH